MKAKEIKKAIEKEYKSRIKSYKSILSEKDTELANIKAQIRELDFLRELLFGIEDTYQFEDEYK